MAKLTVTYAEASKIVSDEYNLKNNDVVVITSAEDQDILIRDNVLELIATGETLQAIKRIREVYGLGLKESKDFVDAIKALNK